MTDFAESIAARLAAARANEALHSAASAFMRESISARYSYNFHWLGRPVIQYPQDIVAVQELVWKVRPDVIVETGIAHGGSLILSASLLALLDLCDASAEGTILDPARPKRRVIGVDIDIRPHNRTAIEAHPLANRIEMIQGSSVAPVIVGAVRDSVGAAERVLVFLDSNHTHDHVLAELQAYAPLVTPQSYCVVFDTIVEHLPKDLSFDRPWSPGNNPKTAIEAWLPQNPQFRVDTDIDAQLVLSVAPGGFLQRID